MRKPLIVLMTAAAASGVVALPMLLNAQSSGTDEAPATPAAQATAPATTQPAQAVQPSGLNEDQRISYLHGYDLGFRLAQQGAALADTEQFIAGLRDGLAQRQPKLSQDELMQTLGVLQQRHRQQNAQMNEQFFAQNKQREGVKTTASGLQYEVLKEGDGAAPKLGDTVVVNYQGRLLTGQVFDSSEQHGGPADFEVGKVIAGWNEGLQLMKPGSKYRLFIPPVLAYGEQGAGQTIPPDAALIFEVELLEVKPAQ